ncbi:beta-lactamase [Paenibacillus beijingensis]|uniref:Beta-lactamase n=2 Tax=Paenibacillus beijingensis TaxID=1126833 RepID=A0A0D5NQ45_9BACL|nr:beta-lactamase [Paenibacillus beijingensis]
MGVPRVYCPCAVCEEARAVGGNRRLRSLLQIDGLDGTEEENTILIDCGPDWGRQMEAAGLRQTKRILITHAHFDHIGGLVEWADACRWTESRGQAYAPSEVIAEVLGRFPWLKGQIDFHELDAPRMFGDWEVSSWRVHHGKNGYAYAFRFEHKTTGRAFAYCSDSIGLTAEQKRPFEDLDLFILGTSFYHEPYPYETRSVYDVTEAMELLNELRPGRMILTHLSHDIDLRKDYELPQQMQFARTGMKVEI